MTARTFEINRGGFSHEALTSNTAVLVYLSLFFFIGHLFTNTLYGYQRDEFYYVACATKPANGYVDHPPFTPMMAGLSMFVFGNVSPFALRFFPSLAGALVVLLTGLIARELGGNRFAQITAAASTLVAPLYIAVTGLLMPLAFDIFAWTLTTYLIIRIIKYKQQWLWCLIGLTVGIGILNKYNIVFHCAALIIGLLLCSQRKLLLTPGFWVASALAFLISLPNLLWQIHHGFPTIEFLQNLNRTVMTKTSRPEFLLWQAILINPCTIPFWIAGLFFFLFYNEGQPYRFLGWVYLLMLGFMLIISGRPYYLGAVYTPLLAAGPIALQKILQRRNLRLEKTKKAFSGLLAFGAICAVPTILPTLPEWSSLRYELGKNYQDYAEILGWDELVTQVSEVYTSLPEEDRRKAAILTENYGQAGSISILGDTYGLPDAISGHNNYYLWGPRGFSGEVCVVVGFNEEFLRRKFKFVQQVGKITNDHGILNSEYGKPLFICRNSYRPFAETWHEFRRYN